MGPSSFTLETLALVSVERSFVNEKVMAAVPRRTSLRSAAGEKSLAGHGYQQPIGKPATRKVLGEISNKQPTLLGQGKAPAKKQIAKPVSLVTAKQAEKPKKSGVVLQDRQTQPDTRKGTKRVAVEDARPVPVTTAEAAPAAELPQTTVAFSELLQIEDIDSGDRDNPQLCAEYVAEIYQYMMRLEGKYMVSGDFLSNQREVTSAMRAVLIDWLIQVQLRFKLLQETLYVTVSIIDRYLSIVNVPRTKLQLVGVTSMLVASKYEETYAPMVEDFVFVTDRAYSQVQIRAMEGEILKTLEFELGKPFCLQFLRRNSKAGSADALMHTVAKYLMELTLPEADFSAFPPSQVAAAALYLTMKLLGRGSWNPTVEHHSGCTEAQLMPCTQKLAGLLSKSATERKTTAVRNKYASSGFMSVSKMTELQPDAVAASGLL